MVGAMNCEIAAFTTSDFLIPVSSQNNINLAFADSFNRKDVV
jgi:hypothetical protein